MLVDGSEGMSAAPGTPPSPLNVLQRLDLALAVRLTVDAVAVPGVQDLTRGHGLPRPPGVDVAAWIAGLLGLRGLLVDPAEVASVVSGWRRGRDPDSDPDFDPDRNRPVGERPVHQEHRLIVGLHRVFERIRSWSVQGRPLDGRGMLELFELMTRDVPRFRNNHLRRDTPWDAILYVRYPEADRVRACLESFDRAHRYRDHALRFDSLHPVRQSFRVLWHFARIAPFPDFNLTMAWVAMDFYLLHHGYPMLVPARDDRERLFRLLGGPPPLKSTRLENRLLAAVENRTDTGRGIGTGTTDTDPPSS